MIKRCSGFPHITTLVGRKVRHKNINGSIYTQAYRNPFIVGRVEETKEGLFMVWADEPGAVHSTHFADGREADGATDWDLELVND